ncbi:hypothetical protein AVEN_70559-1, partial [Araneus ventricosus]
MKPIFVEFSPPRVVQESTIINPLPYPRPTESMKAKLWMGRSINHLDTANGKEIDQL